MPIITGNLGIHSIDNCTITGNVSGLTANYCIVTGNVGVVNGNHNTIIGNVNVLNGSHNHVRGDVERAAGDHNRVDGCIAHDVGIYNVDKAGRDASGSSLVVRGSGNNVVGFAPGAVSMTTTSSDGSTTTVTRRPGWTAAIVNNYMRGTGRDVSYGSSNIAVGVPRGGAVVGCGIAAQSVERGGVIHNVFCSGRAGSSSSSSSRKRPASTEPPPAKRHKAPVPEAIPDEASAGAGEPVCAVCTDRAVATVNKPCRHACLCVTCARRLADERKLECPICRTELTRIVRLHIAADAGGRPAPSRTPLPTDALGVEAGASQRAPLKDPGRALALRSLGLATAGAVASSSSAARRPRQAQREAASAAVTAPSTPAPTAEAAGSSDAYVIVKTMDGKRYRIAVPRDRLITVDSLKISVQTATGMPHYQQRLIYANCQLEDNKTLAECVVPLGAELALVGRLRGD
jgi:hypothetical protein